MDMCLLCLELRKDADEGIQVESIQWQEENIEKLIEKHFWSMKSITGAWWLCTNCWHVISEFHKFYIRIEDAHAYYTSMLKTEMQDNTQDNTQYNTHLTNNDLKAVTNAIHDAQYEQELPMDTAQEIAEATNTSSTEEEKPLIIKSEIENVEKVTTAEVIAVKAQSRKSKRNKDPLERSSFVGKRKKVLIKKNQKKIKKNRKSKLSKSNNNDDTTDETVMAEVYKSETDSENQTDNNSVSMDSDEGKSRSNPYYKPSTKYQGQDEFVTENFKINCGICQAVEKTFHDVCKHSATEHKQRGFVSCCNKKFFRRSILVEHIHWHLDPEYFKCKDCGKVMADRRCLNIHARVHEKLDRTHICDICGKAFARALALQRHKLTHLPDEEKKYSCDQCGKNFGDNNLLSNHIRSVHLNKYALVCDICGRRMRSKEVFERHMLQHEGLPIPTVSCDVCGLKMTDPRGLKRHKEIQHPEGGRVEYKCHICSKISPTLKAHKKHVQYKHELGYNFKCTVCEKAFKRSISLTEHMATHTGTVLYTCPYCPKTFNSNANMHNHRKKAHPKEWEEACREKYSGNLPPNYKPSNSFSF